MRKHGSAQELQRVRMIAVNMFELDKMPSEIAGCLKVDDQTVRRWRRLWQKSGRDGLKLKPHPGRPCLMSNEQKGQLVEMLGRAPAEHGFDRHFWTTAMIAGLIKQKFDIDYDNNWVGEILHAMGFSWQKPARRARERDETRIAEWRSAQWPELLKKTPNPTA